MREVHVGSDFSGIPHAPAPGEHQEEQEMAHFIVHLAHPRTHETKRDTKAGHQCLLAHMGYGCFRCHRLVDARNGVALP